MNVTVVVGTFGDSAWKDLAYERALPSVPDGVPVVHAHADTLHEARNMGLARVDTEFVVHLDADDELEPGYIEAMAGGQADVRVPAVRYVRGFHWQRVRFPRVAGHRHDCNAECLTDGNWIIIGAAVRSDLVRQLGGWRDFAWSEDWDLWLRCFLAGASFETIRSAVYRAHTRSGSRNRAPSASERLAVHQQIADANGVPMPT